ncbi:MAG: hypothetical protein ACFB10_16960 [Salibacteraceae bacterium]
MDIGKNKWAVDPTGASPSGTEMFGQFNKIGTLFTIENQENVDLEVTISSRTDKSQSKANITIPKNSITKEFAGIPCPVDISIVRDTAVFQSRGDGADLRICYYPKN